MAVLQMPCHDHILILSGQPTRRTSEHLCVLNEEAARESAQLQRSRTLVISRARTKKDPFVDVIDVFCLLPNG